MNEEPERIVRPVLLDHRPGEVLTAGTAPRRVGQIDDVVGAPDVGHHRLHQPVDEAGQVVRALAQRHQAVVLAKRLPHHVHVQVGRQLVGETRMPFDVVVGARDLLRPEEVDRAPRFGQLTGRNQGVQRAQDFQLHGAAAHVVVGAAGPCTAGPCTAPQCVVVLYSCHSNMTLVPGTRLGPYEILAPLAEGPSTSVWSVW